MTGRDRVIRSSGRSTVLRGGKGPPGSATTLPQSLTATPRVLTAADTGRVLTWAFPQALVVQVPAGLPIGFTCKIASTGTGFVDVQAGDGVIVDAPGGMTALTTQYGTLELIPTGTDAYLVRGGDADPGGILDFSDPDNSGLQPGL